MFEDACKTTQNGIRIVINSLSIFFRVCNYIKVYDKQIALIAKYMVDSPESYNFLKRTHSSSEHTVKRGGSAARTSKIILFHYE